MFSLQLFMFFIFFLFSPPSLRQDLAELSQSRLGDSLARPWLRDGYEKVKNRKNMNKLKPKHEKVYFFTFSLQFFMLFTFFMFSTPSLRQDLAELSQSRVGDSLARPWLRDGYEKVKKMKHMKNCTKNIKTYTCSCFRFSF